MLRYHYSVMLNEVLEGMNIVEGGIYLDCTFGQGGYSEAILSRNANVVAVDQDEAAQIFADDLKKKYDKSFNFILDNFTNIDKLTAQFDGIVFDLGLSFTQIRDENRGFSFNSTKSLDMKMSNSFGRDVKQFINNASAKEIADVLYQNADEHRSRKIAEGIVSYRKKKLIETSQELAEVVASSVFQVGYKNVATKTFQALRIWANDEYNVLKVALNKSLKLLKQDGVLCVVSFHSGEDLIVKHFIRDNMIKINKKVIKPSREEVRKNAASRSAVMRLARKKEEI